MITKEKETEIQLAICQYLELKKVFFFRVNNTPISMIRNGQRVFRALPKYARHGVSDLIAVKNGHVYFIEVKTPTGVVSQHQHQFCADVLAAGGTYLLARCVDDVMTIL